MKNLLCTLLWLVFVCVNLCAQPWSDVTLSQPEVAAATSYTASGVTFAGDGQCWLERDADLTGISDGNAITISLWYKPAENGVLVQFVQGNSGRPSFNRQSANTLRFSAFDPSGTEVLRINSSLQVTNDGNWHHLLFSVDRSVDNRGYIYIDGEDRTSIATFLSTAEDADPIDLTRGDYSVGGAVGETGTSDVNGCMSEVWFAAEYIDITQESERLKFRSSDGHPVSLGSDGSTPTGTAPLLYLKGDYTSFTANSGTGGNMVKKGTTDFTTCTAP